MVNAPAVTDFVPGGFRPATLTGTAEAGSAVAIYDNNVLLGAATADDQGHWTFQFRTLSGQHSFTEIATGSNGPVASAGVALVALNATPLVGDAGDDVLIDGPHVGILGSRPHTLTGGAGDDTFVFNAHFGKATVTDFDVNAEVLSFDHSLFAVDTAAQVLSQAHDTATGMVIVVDAVTTLTLLGVHVADLQAHPEDIHFF